MTTVLIVAVLLVLSFIAGVCESNRVIAEVKRVGGAVTDVEAAVRSDLSSGEMALHQRIQALEVTTATRITAVEDSIKAKL